MLVLVVIFSLLNKVKSYNMQPHFDCGLRSETTIYVTISAIQNRYLKKLQRKNSGQNLTVETIDKP
jgi:uncharacterized protein YktB (UPF0637 family)